MSTPLRSLGASVAGLAMLRWAAAAAVAVSAHGGVAWYALHHAPAEAMQGDPPPAVMLELAPLPVAPPTPAQEIASGPQMSEAQPEPQPEPEPEPEPVPEPEPLPEPEPVKPVVEAPPTPEPPPQVEPPEIKPPELPQQEKAEAVLAPPPKPQPPKKRKPRKKEQTERRKPVNPDKPKQSHTAAPPSMQAKQAERSAAPSAGASSAPSVSPASWKSALVAHLNRYKRFPPDAAGTGTASVAFTITRSGQVLSARLVSSAGDTALDREAVALPRRASPLPAPPAGFGGQSITLSVPIRFNH
jgi:protein TonB